MVANSGFRLLKSKLNPFSYQNILTQLLNQFFFFVESTYWGGTWGKHTRSVGFKTLFDYQKMNHFPGTFQIGRKDRLWKSMQKLMSKFGKQKYVRSHHLHIIRFRFESLIGFIFRFDLMPTTYILPQDKKFLRLVWKKNGTQDPWIVKPVNICPPLRTLGVHGLIFCTIYRFPACVCSWNWHSSCS